MRNFEVTITDRDGEEHSYQVVAKSVGALMAGLAKRMHSRKGFYGHDKSLLMNVQIFELTQDADMSNAVTL